MDKHSAMNNANENNASKRPNRDYMPQGSTSYFKSKQEAPQDDIGRADAEKSQIFPSHISSHKSHNTSSMDPTSHPSASLPLIDIFAPPVRKKHTGLKIIAAAAVFMLLCVLGGALYVLFDNGFFEASPAVEDDIVLPDIMDIQEEEADEDTTDIAIYTLPQGRTVQLEVTELEQDRETLSNADVYELCIESTVSIYAESGGGLYASLGTGIIMTDDGFIITNNHIIEDTEYLEITLNNGETYEGFLVGRDPTYDIAVLKIDAHGLKEAEFGNSDALRAGDPVVAIGNPSVYETLTGSITAGIVSANNRRLVMDGTMMTLIQTDAPLNSGNSGGPLINQYGQVVGINVMKYVVTDGSNSYEGLGFAIPISAAKPIIDELIENGAIIGRPSLGIMALEVAADDVEEGSPAGVYVSELIEGSKAEECGIQPGDIIIGVEGENITTRDELVEFRDKCRAGDILNITVYRSGEYINIDLELSDEGEIG